MRKGFEFVKGSVGGKEKTSFFKNSEFFSQNQPDLKSVDPSYCIFASAPFGGPIAVTYDSSIRMLGSKPDDSLRNRINFFGNNGSLLKSNYFTTMHQIALFDFIEEELLLVVYTNGLFMLVHPIKGAILEGNLGSQFQTQQKIEAGCIVKNGVVFYTKQRSFYYVKNVLESEPAVQFKEPCEEFIKKEFFFGVPFLAISSDVSSDRNINLVIPNFPFGLLFLSENKKTLSMLDSDLGNLPPMQSIIMMTASRPFITDPASPGKHKVNLAILTDDKLLFMIPELSPKGTWCTKVDYNEGIESKRPKGLAFCGPDAVIIYFQRSMLIVTDGGTKIVAIDKVQSYFGFPEVDGLRILSFFSEKMVCSIFRKASKAYLKIFKSASYDPAAMLYQITKDFLKKMPSADTDVSTNKEQLCQAVEDCMSAALFEINEKKQKRLLQAASYGKTFLNQELMNPNFLSEKCTELKVLYNMKEDSKLKRVMTSDQLHFLGESNLLKIIMRYDAHYLALRICTFWKLSEDLVNSVYIDWALKKIENESNKPSEILAREIHDKLKEQPGISYTEIAKKANELKKEDLAVFLLEKEGSACRKVPILLSMKDSQRNCELALEEAVKSQDSNLIYFCIVKTLKKYPEPQSAPQKLVNSRVIKAHLMNYLTVIEANKKKIEFLRHFKLFDEAGYECIAQAGATRNLADRVALLKLCVGFWSGKFKDFPAEKLVKIVSRYEETNSKYLEACRKSDTILAQKTISKTLEEIVSNQPKLLKDFQKTAEISDRRVLLSQLVSYARQNEWKKFEELINEKNKKSELVAWEDVVEIVRDFTEEQRIAEPYIAKISDEDTQFDFWVGCQSWRKAADFYGAKHRVEMLQRLQGVCSDEGSRVYIESRLKEASSK